MNLTEKLDKLIAIANEQGIEIELLQQLHENRLDCVWYGGDLFKITKGNYELIVGAYGDVRALLEDKEGERTSYVRDRGNWGRFYDEMSPHIANDNELYELIDSGLLNLDDSNWLEWRVYDKTQETYIGPSCFDNIYDSNNVLDCLDINEINAVFDYAIAYGEE